MSLHGGNEKGIRHVEYSIAWSKAGCKTGGNPVTCPSTPFHLDYLTLHERIQKPRPCSGTEVCHRPETFCI